MTDEPDNDEKMLRDVWARMHEEADTPDEPDEPEAPAPGAERDASGRFAAKSKEAAPEAPAGEPEVAAKVAPPETGKQLSDLAQKPAEATAQPGAEDDVTRKLPRAVAAVWKDIPETARAAILADRKAMADRVSDAGREAAPFRRVQEKLHADFPETRGWTPEQLSERLTTIARFEQALSADPARTLLITARDLGVLPQLRQVLGGAAASEAEQVLPQLVAEIKTLREQLGQQPMLAEQRAQEAVSRGRVEDTIADFRRDCGEEWNVVEASQLLPDAIMRVRQAKPDMSPRDILAEAYEQVAWSIPETRQSRIDAQVKASASPATSPREEASRRALGARIPNRGADAAAGAPKTLDASLRETYRRLTQ